MYSSTEVREQDFYSKNEELFLTKIIDLEIIDLEIIDLI